MNESLSIRIRVCWRLRYIRNDWNKGLWLIFNCVMGVDLKWMVEYKACERNVENAFIVMTWRLRNGTLCLFHDKAQANPIADDFFEYFGTEHWV